MDCEKFYDLIIKQVTGNTSVEESLAIQNHVKQCSQCSENKAEFQQVWDHSANLSRLALSDKKITHVIGSTFGTRAILLPIISTCAAALILIGIFFLTYSPSNPEYKGTFLTKNGERLRDSIKFGEKVETVGKSVIQFNKNQIELENGSQVTIENRKMIKIHKGKALVSIEDDADGIDIHTDLGKVHANNARFLIEVFYLNGGQTMKSTTVVGVLAVGVAIIAGTAIFTNFFGDNPHKLKEGDRILIDGKDKKVVPVSFEEFNTLKEKVSSLESEKQRLESENKMLRNDVHDLKAKLEKPVIPDVRPDNKSLGFMSKVKVDKKYMKLLSLKDFDWEKGMGILLKMTEAIKNNEDTQSLLSSPEITSFFLNTCLSLQSCKKRQDYLVQMQQVPFLLL